MFGAGQEEMEGIKEAYNKNTAVGKALKKEAKSAINKGYDMGEKAVRKQSKPLADYMAKHKVGTVKKMSGVTGLGLKLGNGLSTGGSCCEGCGMAYNDKFVFSKVAL